MAKDGDKNLPLAQVQLPATQQLMTIIGHCVEADKGTEMIECLAKLQWQHEDRQAIKSFTDAFAAFQDEVPIIEKNEHVKYLDVDYWHSSIADIRTAVTGPLSNNGLSYRFEYPPSTDLNVIIVTCILAHRDGYSTSTTMSGPPDTSGKKSPLKAMLSTTTTLRRYTLIACLGLAETDDDVKGELAELPPAKEDGQYLSDEFFEKSLPSWQKQIESGKKTVNEVYEYVNKKKNRKFTDKQCEILNSLKVQAR